MTAPDLATLRRLAEAARDAQIAFDAFGRNPNLDDILDGKEIHSAYCRAVDDRKAFIAAVNPTAALALLARLDRAEAALRHLAGSANECTWHKSTRHIAADIQDTIVTYFAEVSAP